MNHTSPTGAVWVGGLHLCAALRVRTQHELHCQKENHSLNRLTTGDQLYSIKWTEMLLSTFKGLPTYNKHIPHWHIHQRPICEHDHDNSTYRHMCKAWGGTRRKYCSVVLLWPIQVLCVGGFNSNDGGRVDIKHIKMFLVSDVGMTMNTKFPWLRGWFIAQQEGCSFKQANIAEQLCNKPVNERKWQPPSVWIVTEWQLRCRLNEVGEKRMQEHLGSEMDGGDYNISQVQETRKPCHMLMTMKWCCNV